MKRKLPVLAPLALMFIFGGVIVAAADPDPHAPSGTPGAPTLPVTLPPQPSVVSPSSTNSPAGSGFTYQGQLKDGPDPADGQYDFTFRLFDALSGGGQVGSTITLTNQTVSEGLFTVQLDFGAGAINGEARWLQIAVRQAGGGAFTTLTPRQPLTATPYAASLIPGATVRGANPWPDSTLSIHNSDSGNAIYATSISGTALFGVGYGAGIFGLSSNGSGVSGQSGFLNDPSTGSGIHGLTYGTGIGVFGDNVGHGSGVAGRTDGPGFGVEGRADIGTGVFGESTDGHGVAGLSTNSYAMKAYGHASQSRDKSGWAKALVRVAGSSITRCYNSQGLTPNTTAPCGFSISGSGGDYLITFPFTVNDRFATVTPEYAAAQAVIPTVAFPAANQLRVRTYSGGSTLIDSAFYLVVY